MLRREGYAGKVTLISADADLPCDRPNVSKDYLAGGMPEDWLYLRTKEAWAEAGVELMLGTRAQSIDSKGRVVKLENGATVAYGALLLATGGDPIRLPIPGADLPHVHLLRTVDDARRVVAQLPNAKSAVVIGSSFIGLEAAASLRARGLEVHVVAPDKVPFENVLGFQAGAIFKALHEKNGVVFHLGRRPAAIGAGAVTLDDGSRVNAQLVVIGVGVRPALSLAESAGVKVSKGVEVDAQLRTSDANIWAAGDIAAYPDLRSGGERVRTRALGRRTAPGADRRESDAGAEREVRHRAVLLDEDVRPQPSLRRARHRVGSHRRSRRGGRGSGVRIPQGWPHARSRVHQP